jgi:hypothetical protein
MLTGPEAGAGELSDPERHWLRETKAAQKELLRVALESEREKEVVHRSEEEQKLAGIMKAGTAYLPPDAVRRIIQVAGEGAEGYLDTTHRLDAKVWDFTKYYPGADQNKVWEQSETILREFEKAMLS